MIEIVGRHNSAIVFAHDVEETASKQIRELCDQSFTEGSRIRVMPDVHAGAGCTIGTTMTISDKIVPNLVGVDIGCGMEVAAIENRSLDCAALDRTVHERIPAGFKIRNSLHPFVDRTEIGDLRCAESVDLARARKSVGTLGGGNHFIEANRDDDGNLYIVVHSGSRHLGLEVAQLYQKEAFRQLNHNTEREQKDLIDTLKSTGRAKDIGKSLTKLRKQVITTVPRELAYASGALFDDYIHDMKIVQEFALWNRRAMMAEIVDALGLTVTEKLTTIHNYVDIDNMVLRKGAVSAQFGQVLLIPMNMRDGSLICVGKGNEDWNCSAPHGAGRLMSRTQAKKQLSLNEFQKSMSSVFTTSVSTETIDEAPMAYKPMESIIGQISDTVDITRRIRPIYNFKAAE